MTNLKLLVQPIKLAFAISLVSFGFFSAQTQAAKSVILGSSPPTINDSPSRLFNAQLNTSLIFNAPPPPDADGEAWSRARGGRLDSCKVD